MDEQEEMTKLLRRLIREDDPDKDWKEFLTLKLMVTVDKVSDLEAWRNRMLGGLALVAIAVPVAVKLL